MLAPSTRCSLTLFGVLALGLAGCSGPGNARPRISPADAAWQAESGEPQSQIQSPPVEGPTAATDEETAALARASQNPVADLISLPFQNNTDFGIGPDDATKNTLNIQPVVPFGLTEDWNVITRTIVPVVNQPVPGESDEFGLGDTTFSAFFSPRDSGGIIWGVGPIALIPTSTDDALGAGEWGGGASAVGLWMSGPWVAGGIVSNIWSFESSAVNLFTVQPFVNYNLDAGWYLTTAPIITSNWEADSDDRWLVPLGGGAGRVFHVGTQPVNFNVQYYSYVESPAGGPDWQLRVQLQLLFPKG